jgi:hypothetical protein
MLRSAKSWILAGGVGASLLALNAPAKADIIPQFTSVTPSGSDFLWSYTATLTSEQFLNASAGPNDPGSYFTIYDFAGYVSGSATTPNANWVFSSANMGVTPSDVTITDDPLLPNLTWKYIGPVTGHGPINLGTFTAKSIFDDETLVNYSAMGKKWHKHLTSPYAPFLDHGTPTSNKGITIAPMASTVPEPCSLALLGLGAAPLLARRRRARSQA